MNLCYTDQQKAFRREIAEWLRQHVPVGRLQSFDTREGFEQHRQWEATLNKGRWSMVTWPEIFGGRGCGLVEWLIFEEEYYRAEAPLRVNQNGIFLLGPTLMEYGTDEQKMRFLPKMASAEEVWAQGWSEPDAGSDMAAIRAKAERSGDTYIINGRKTWSTRAAYADWVFGIFRTDPAAERHRGLSFILVPLNAGGITIRPIPQLDRLPGFAEISFDNVVVSEDCRLGAEGQGWQLAMATAGFERSLILRSPARFQETARRLIRLYRQNQDAADRDPGIRNAVLDAYLRAEAYTLTTYRTASRLNKGESIGSEASANKIFWSELDQEMHATAMAILDARAELLPHAPEVEDQGRWLNGFLHAQSGPIYAGTNEIQRNIIAERMLNMPRN